MDASAPEPSAVPDSHKYLRRRRIASAGALVACPALLGIFLAVGFSDSEGDAPARPAPAEQATGLDGDDQLRTSSGQAPGLADELDTAEEHHTAAGTYVGYPASLPHAANSVSVIVASGTGAACVYAGIIDGDRSAELTDPSGQACDEAELAALQIELDRQDAARGTAAGGQSDQLLQRAIAMAQRAAASNIVDGQPSFLGITTLPLDGVAVVPGNGDDVVVRTTTGPCRQATVLASGHASDPAPC